jgi:hypothetical protein
VHEAGAVTGLKETVTWLGSTAVLIPLLVAVGGYLVWSRRSWSTTLLDPVLVAPRAPAERSEVIAGGRVSRAGG